MVKESNSGVGETPQKKPGVWGGAPTLRLEQLSILNYINIMKITHYSFGKITIDGKTYTSDVIIYPDHVNPSWWRKEGHLLQIEDLTDILKAGVSILIIGTGYYGTMRVPDETLNFLISKNMEVYYENTKEAVKIFKNISSKKPSIAAFHLTC